MSEDTVAHLSGVTHRYGSVVALEEVDLEVRRGEVLAVLGPNGAGKTTAIHLLLGSLPVQTGEAASSGGGPTLPRFERAGARCSRSPAYPTR